jgi:hypothetical protein
VSNVALREVLRDRTAYILFYARDSHGTVVESLSNDISLPSTPKLAAMSPVVSSERLAAQLSPKPTIIRPPTPHQSNPLKRPSESPGLVSPAKRSRHSKPYSPKHIPPPSVRSKFFDDLNKHNPPSRQLKVTSTNPYTSDPFVVGAMSPPRFPGIQSAITPGANNAFERDRVKWGIKVKRKDAMR